MYVRQHKILYSLILDDVHLTSKHFPRPAGNGELPYIHRVAPWRCISSAHPANPLKTEHPRDVSVRRVSLALGLNGVVLYVYVYIYIRWIHTLKL